MKFSIITVTYNAADTVLEAINSVSEQTYPNIEHIVIDGGSTDGTVDIVCNNSDRIYKFTSEPDSGIYNAMNKGLSIATGDFVGFLNADDIFADKYSVAKLHEACTTNPKVDILFADLNYVAISKLGAIKIIRKWITGTFSYGAMRRGWMPPHPTFYIRRSCLTYVGNFDENLRIAADYDFMLRSLRVCKFNYSYIPSVLVNMRIGGASNQSFRAILKKSREDMIVIHRHSLDGILTLFLKNLRKITQFL